MKLDVVAKIFQIIFPCLLLACVKNDKVVDWDAELSKFGDMGKAYKTFANEKCIGKCQWTNPEAHVLAFEGKIEEGSYLEFMSKISDDIREIRLNSGGGVVKPALKIGEEIYKRKLKVVVKGFCISSCANYLFLAGSEKVIDGIVGFHGSSQASLQQSKYCEKDASRPACVIGVQEKLFFERVGIAEILFDLTQSKDKGMGDGKIYMYYAPSKSTLAALGVRGIIGDQSEEFLKQLAQLHKNFNDNDFLVASDPNPAMTTKLKELKDAIAE